MLKIAKIVRLLKIVKIIKIFTNLSRDKLISKLLYFASNSALMTKLIKFFLIMIISVHNIACLFYFTSSLHHFNEQTWI